MPYITSIERMGIEETIDAAPVIDVQNRTVSSCFQSESAPNFLNYRRTSWIT